MPLIQVQYKTADELRAFGVGELGLANQPVQLLGREAGSHSLSMYVAPDQRVMSYHFKAFGALAGPLQYAPDDYISFGIDNQDIFCEGVHMGPQDLRIGRGMNYLVTSTFWNARFIHIREADAKLFFSDEALDRMTCCSVQLSPAEKSRFAAFHAQVEQGQLEVAEVCHFLSDLLDDSLRQFRNQKVEGWDLGVELVQIAHSQTPEERIRLPDLTRMLLSNKDKITEVSKTLFQLTPMQLLRHVRLRQCRYLIQEGSSIEQARLNYGFSNRKDFNERYQGLFGELPTETLVTA